MARVLHSSVTLKPTVYSDGTMLGGPVSGAMIVSPSPVILVCRGALCAVLPHPANAFRPYLLRHPVLAFLNALILCTTLGSTLVLSLTPDIARLSTVTASTLTSLTNAERVKTGLPALRESQFLRTSARLKGEHMIRYDYFEHTSPNGVAPWAWFDAAHYAYVNAGENLAIDFTTAESVVTAWMRSPGHRRNILSTQYDDIGMAVVSGEFEGRDTTMVVLHLGRGEPPPPAPGAVSYTHLTLPTTPYV